QYERGGCQRQRNRDRNQAPAPQGDDRLRAVLGGDVGGRPARHVGIRFLEANCRIASRRRFARLSRGPVVAG
ncbi:MAG: hypothetical protein VX311_16225, partial [Planctomycetota bacterium]|nr:hypothetical protein [Planctomycetota bacterium]